MESIKLFNGLIGSKVSRSEIQEIIDLAKSENQTDIIYRLSTVLNENPNEDRFEITAIEKYSSGLNAARHAGIYKEALDSCGRLNKGFKFENGTIIKVLDKKTQDLKIKLARLKSKYGLRGYNQFPEIVQGLNGTFTADGHAIITDEELAAFGEPEYFGGLNAAAKDVEVIVNELILEKIKTGAKLPPWKQSWAAKSSILAQNFETKKEYTGSNAMILNVLLGSMMPTPYYLTANQITNMGGMINKGAKSVPLVYYNFIFTLRDFSGDAEKERSLLSKIANYEVKRKGKKTIVLNKSNYAGVSLSQNEVNYLNLEKDEYFSKGFLKYYRVFNIADTNGIKYELPESKPKSGAERIEIAEAIIKGFPNPPKIVFGKKEALYNSMTDTIEMPNIGDFDPIEEYYTTLFHELIHATKVKDRLNRDEKYKGKVQDAQYAFEELIAELGASYLAGIAGILEVVHINSAAYLKDWHEKLQGYAESNSDFFIYATREAQKAADYVLKNFVDPKEKKTEKESAPKYDPKVIALAKAKALKLKLKLKLA